MKIVYDKYYKTEDLFGDAYPELIEFFSKYPVKGKVLDLGCGQGRDAIPLARLGFEVLGVDNSIVGIEQMTQKSKIENLKVSGIVEDIYLYDNFYNFDIIVLDSMFHFEKKDLEREKALIIKIVSGMKKEGLLCVCIQDTGSKVKILKETIESVKQKFDVLNDSTFTYKFSDKKSGHHSNTPYCMYIIQKI